MNPNEPERVAFSVAWLNGVTPPRAGRRYVYDARTPGLAICVAHTGRRTFYWIGRVGAKSGVRKRIGQYPRVGLTLARKRAAKHSTDVTMGVDITSAAKRIKGEKQLGHLWDWYLEHHAKTSKRSWKRDVSTWNRDLSKWKNRRLSSISAAEIQELMTSLQTKTEGKDKLGRKRILGGPGAANKALALLQSMYSTAVEPLKWIDADHVPTKKIEEVFIPSRKRYLTEDELPTFFEKLGTLNPRPRDIFILALFTGARRSNVAAMRWDQIDFRTKLWTIPYETYKGKDDSVVALVPEAVEILERRRGEVGDSPWVFPGIGKTGHFICPKGAWKRLLSETGLKNLRMHDLRRTMGSWQLHHGSSLELIGKSLGHRSREATLAYAHMQMQPVRESMERATNAMMAAGGKINFAENDTARPHCGQSAATAGQ